jgi:intracellular septation protein
MPARGRHNPQIMKWLLDYFPLVVFFVAYRWQGIYVATAVAIAASVLQIAWLRWRRHPVGTVHWLGLAVIVVFGGATLVLQDEMFIKWKPTILYWLFCAILLVGKVVFRRDWVAKLFQGQEFDLPGNVWSRLTWSWIVFFAAMGIVNIAIAYRFPTDTWVNFKVWGAMGLFLLFALAQGFAIARYLPDQRSN